MTDDQPQARPAATESASTVPATDVRAGRTEPAALPTRRPAGLRRGIATVALTLGLLALGGVSAVMAASPDPSASPSASQGTGGSTGTDGAGGTGAGHNCPADATDGTTNGATDGASPSAGTAS